MNKEQKKHLRSIKTRFNFLVDAKYRAGAKFHKNDLLDKTPLTFLLEARGELIDGFVYVQTAIDKLCEKGANNAKTTR